ncbi:hypothetical protein QW131_29705 [Roseibium salinum]|nr:hypothetical protein [Roseibium salinum]
MEIGDATVVLPRISRREATDEMRLIVSDAPTVDVLLSSDFARYYTIKQIYPQPDHSEATDTGLRLRFALAGKGSKEIAIDLIASRIGLTSFEISIGTATRTVRTMVLP